MVHRRDVLADGDRDFTVHARVTDALAPGQQYFYRFFTCERNSPIGRFRTARPADSREPVRVAFFSCQDYQVGFYTAHGGLADEDVDLVVCLGDYVYERAFFEDPVREDKTAPDGETQTLEEYRRKYQLYQSDSNLIEVRRNFPLVAIWDDHEVEDNYANGLPGGQTENRRVPFDQRKANGYRAWNEHLPRAASNRIYGSRRLGANLELMLLDQRQYRDDQPCNPQDSFVAPACPESERNAPRTMLGAEQKAWFKDALARSTATWKVVGSQLMWMALDFPPRTPLNTDAWDGYGAERRELLEHIQANGIQNVSFVTGDIHTFFAGSVTPSGREGVPAVDGVPVATEFVSGSITSPGIADQLGEPPAQFVALPSDSAVLASNPHIKFSNQAFKGYGVVEARTDELLVEYRSPRTIKEPRAETFTLEGFRVAAGSPAVEPRGAVLDRTPPRLPELPGAAAGTAGGRAAQADVRDACAAERTTTRRRRRSGAGDGGGDGGDTRAGGGGTLSGADRGGGELPVTGFDLRPMSALGAALLAGGAALLRGARNPGSS